MFQGTRTTNHQQSLIRSTVFNIVGGVYVIGRKQWSWAWQGWQGLAWVGRGWHGVMAYSEMLAGHCCRNFSLTADCGEILLWFLLETPTLRPTHLIENNKVVVLVKRTFQKAVLKTYFST